MTVILELSEEELKKLENITGVDSIETEQDAAQVIHTMIEFAI